jgi:hypothetical protein
MDPYTISLADVFRILEALDRTGGDRLIQGIKERAPMSTIEYGRVTLGMMLQLLRQTDGSTTLPDEIVAMLRQSRLGGGIFANAQPLVQPIGAAHSSWSDALNNMPPHKRISIETVEDNLRVEFSTAQKLALRQIPFAKQTLASCHRTHMLFPGFPLTIDQLSNIVSDRGIFNNAAHVVARSTTCGQQQLACRWYLLRCGVTPKSTGQGYYNQLTWLPKHEEVPQLAEVVFGMVLKAIVYDDHLFKRQYVRCAPLPGNTDQPIVGCFTKQGFEMRVFGPTKGIDNLGLASMRKLNT